MHTISNIVASQPQPDATCQRCGMGHDSDGDGDCAYCHRMPYAEARVYFWQAQGRELNMAQHNAQVDAMLQGGTYGSTGRYRDPVSGRLFPRGLHMVHDATRPERQRLKRWRRTGKVKGYKLCIKVPEVPHGI